MSKVIPIALLNHLQGETTQLAYLWLVTRKDGQVFGFTSHDADIALGGVTYLARSGFDASQISTSADLAVDNMQVGGLLISNVITDDDLLNRIWDYAEVRLSRCKWSDPAAGVEKIRLGWLGEVSLSKYGFKTELLGLMQKLQQPVGRAYMAECDTDLGSTRCKVNILTFTVTGTVTSAASLNTFADSTKSQADGWFKGGKLTWLTGANAGRSMEVKAFTSAGGVFELQEGMQGLISPGDTYSVYAGCNKVRDLDCLSKFNNTINHRGFPVKPTEDRLQSGK